MLQFKQYIHNINYDINPGKKVLRLYNTIIRNGNINESLLLLKLYDLGFDIDKQQRLIKHENS